MFAVPCDRPSPDVLAEVNRRKLIQLRNGIAVWDMGPVGDDTRGQNRSRVRMMWTGEVSEEALANVSCCYAEDMEDYRSDTSSIYAVQEETVYHTLSSHRGMQLRSREHCEHDVATTQDMTSSCKAAGC